MSPLPLPPPPGTAGQGQMRPRGLDSAPVPLRGILGSPLLVPSSALCCPRPGPSLTASCPCCALCWCVARPWCWLCAGSCVPSPGPAVAGGHTWLRGWGPGALVGVALTGLPEAPRRLPRACLPPPVPFNSNNGQASAPYLLAHCCLSHHSHLQRGSEPSDGGCGHSNAFPCAQGCALSVGRAPCSAAAPVLPRAGLRHCWVCWAALVPAAPGSACTLPGPGRACCAGSPSPTAPAPMCLSPTW